MRLLFLLGILIAIGATSSAMGQDRNTGLDDMSQSKDHIANQPKATNTDQIKASDKSKAKENKKEAKKEDNGHRKHWWSLPHRHKKQDKDAKADIKAKDGKNSNNKTVAANPSSKASGHQVASSKNSTHPMAAKSAHKNATKTAHATTAKPVHTKSASKNASVKKTGKKSVASSGHSNKSVAANRPSKKPVARASQSKRTAHHDCSTAEAKKGGCQAVKAHGEKTTKATTKVS